MRVQGPASTLEPGQFPRSAQGSQAECTVLAANAERCQRAELRAMGRGCWLAWAAGVERLHPRGSQKPVLTGMHINFERSALQASQVRGAQPGAPRVPRPPPALGAHALPNLRRFPFWFAVCSQMSRPGPGARPVHSICRPVCWRGASEHSAVIMAGHSLIGESRIRCLGHGSLQEKCVPCTWLWREMSQAARRKSG